jgi:hypothetical protein
MPYYIKSFCCPPIAQTRLSRLSIDLFLLNQNSFCTLWLKVFLNKTLSPDKDRWVMRLYDKLDFGAITKRMENSIRIDMRRQYEIRNGYPLEC